MMLMLATFRRLVTQDRLVREGRWREGRPELYHFPRLMGLTLGLISFGHVARAVAMRAKPFGVHIIAFDPFIEELVMSPYGVEPVTLDELLARSDIISMHAPGTDQTNKMLTDRHFAAMKKTALFINTGRGATVDEAALIKALQEKKIAAAGLDVHEPFEHRAEAFLKTGLAGCGKGAIRAAVERAVRGDDPVASAGRAPRHLDRSFVGLGAAVAEEHPVGERRFDEPLGEARTGLVVVEVRGVDELACLLADRRDHGRMRVPERRDGKPREQIEVSAPGLVPEPAALPVRERDWIAGVVLRREAVGRIHDRKARQAFFCGAAAACGSCSRGSHLAFAFGFTFALDFLAAAVRAGFLAEPPDLGRDVSRAKAGSSSSTISVPTPAAVKISSSTAWRTRPSMMCTCPTPPAAHRSRTRLSAPCRPRSSPRVSACGLRARKAATAARRPPS